MTDELTDLTPDLVERAAGGDTHAVERIVRALQRPVYAVALRMLHSPRDAEDATQEALIRIVTRLAQYRGEARFSTWALRIAVHRVVDYRRERAPRLSFEQFSDDLQTGLDPQADERPEDEVLLKQLRHICSRAMLQCLDTDHRIAFVLGEILELNGTEAAEVLEIEPAAFRKRLSRARRALEAFVQANCSVAQPDAPCACHRRLPRALALGRVQRDQPDAHAVAGEPLRELRRRLHTLPSAQRLGALLRDGAEHYAPNFGDRLRAVLSRRPD